MTPEDALKRIKKCLALANSCEPHEAAAAVRQAKALMQKYSLNQDDVEVSEIVEIETSTSKRDLEDWESLLASTIKKYMGVEALFQSGKFQKNRYVKPSLWSNKKPYYTKEYSNGVIYFIGPKHRATVAVYIYEGLMRQLNKARKDRRLELGFPRLTKHETTLFNLGWVMAVAPKIKALSPTPADQATSRYVEGTNASAHQPNKNTEKAFKHDRGEFSNGFRSGQNAQLHHGVEKGASQKMIN